MTRWNIWTPALTLRRLRRRQWRRRAGLEPRPRRVPILPFSDWLEASAPRDFAVTVPFPSPPPRTLVEALDSVPPPVPVPTTPQEGEALAQRVVALERELAQWKLCAQVTNERRAELADECERLRALVRS